MVAWSLRYLARGIHPTEREVSGGMWRSSLDDGFRGMSGSSLGFKAVCCYLKQDLMELGTSLGFPGHGTKLAPCALCRCTMDNWAERSGVSPLGNPWGDHDLATYDAACKACEREVVLNPRQYSDIRQLLAYDADTARGRSLTAAYPELGLRKGDRLEPCETVPNLALFDSMRPEPGQTLRVVFWTRHEETKVRRRNPLFCAATSLSPAELAIDWLHNLSLGLFGYWTNACVHELYAADIFNIRRTGEELEIRTLGILRSMAGKWKAREATAGKQRTVPSNITRGMIGKRGAGTSFQGAEANSFLCFLLKVVLPERQGSLTAPIWVPMQQTGHALLKMYELLSAHKGTSPRDAIQDKLGFE